MELFAEMMKNPPKHPFPDHIALSKHIASEGMVLLKNENNILPLPPQDIGLFGGGAIDTAICGTGSGNVFTPYRVTIKEGLENVGFNLLSRGWLDRYKELDDKANREDKTLTFVQRQFSGHKIFIDELAIEKDDLEALRSVKTVIYAIRRSAGENSDRKAIEGDYYLSKTEKDNLEFLSKEGKDIVVVLNTTVIDLNFIYQIGGIKAVILMGLAGTESGNALADIVTGKVNPSGKLTDTWAKKYEDNPASATFSHNDGITLQEDYLEDIYVGYRFFDTFNIEPLFPFGFGLSYTNFKINLKDIFVNWKSIKVLVEVKNIGNAEGKEVTQVYISSPEGELDKPYQELVGFEKTKLLSPNEVEVLEITIPIEYLASYSMEKAAFICESGNYVIRLGNHSRNTKVIGIVELDKETIIRQVSNKMTIDRDLNILKAPKRKSEAFDNQVKAFNLFKDEYETIDNSSKIINQTITYIPEGQTHNKAQMGKNYTPPFPAPEVIKYVKYKPNACLLDVKNGEVTMEEFVASLDNEVLFRLVTGISNETPYPIEKRLKEDFKAIEAPRSSGATTSQYAESLGIQACYMTDGPAGLHILGSPATAWPTGLLMAQTWDMNFCELMGEAIGKELLKYNHRVILGPGMNIHRDPLCGRNFEYYSEDPLLTGKIAAHTTIGVQKPGTTSVALKHFAANNQEEDRITGNSSLSERALREIYLRGFEIAVKEGKAKTIMTSYNKINGIHASSHYELLTDILRGEWSFDGLVMTDWNSQSIKPLDLHAGNDLIMGGYRTDHLKAAMEGKKAEFGEDGYVRNEVLDVYGGFFKEEVSYWNSFELDAKGLDRISTMVSPNQELNSKIQELVENGQVEITENQDKSKTITYKGYERGQYLVLGDLQKSAIRVLNFILSSYEY